MGLGDPVLPPVYQRQFTRTVGTLIFTLSASHIRSSIPFGCHHYLHFAVIAIREVGIRAWVDEYVRCFAVPSIPDASQAAMPLEVSNVRSRRVVNRDDLKQSLFVYHCPISSSPAGPRNRPHRRRALSVFLRYPFDDPR